MTTRVSIVIPAYNAERYLADAIESVLAQDHPDLELIVVDDGSTDGTPRLLDRYGDRLRRVWQPNSGQSAALNLGWEKSSGSIIGYLSADDLLKPGAVSASVAVFDRWPEAVATYGDYELMSPDSVRIRRVRTRLCDFRGLLEFTNVPGPGTLFRREACERAGPWNPRFRQMPDLDFLLRIGQLGEFRSVPHVLASYRLHPDSISFSDSDIRSADESIEVIESFLSTISHPDHARLGQHALSIAHVVAARAHMRSGRIAHARRRLAEAWKISPRAVLTRHGMRIVLNGLASRSVYRMLFGLLRKGEQKA